MAQSQSKTNGQVLLEKLQRLHLTAEDKYFFRRYGGLVSALRRDTVLQARLLHGIVVPPHERAMLRPIRWPQFDEYHFIGSRGTAKSFVLSSAATTLYAEVFARKKISALSASKFRGGKVIMEEALSLINGALDSQTDAGSYVKRMLRHGKGLKREGDRWLIPFSTESTLITVPTGNEESARGLRAHWLVLDEADNWAKNTVDKIFGPFLAVGGNFRAPGAAGAKNKIFFTGTVSYTHKDWAKVIQDREGLIRSSFEAEKLLLAGDFDSWQKAVSDNNERLLGFSVHLQRWDYTDLIIPLQLGNHEIFYPNVNESAGIVEINPADIIKYDRRDKTNFIFTYPVEKEMAERQLDDGLTDFDTWAAEWRCQFIETSGNVYPFNLIERATNTELLEWADLAEAGWDVEERGPYYPPVLYSCSDPCVLGVDPARTSDDTAFVVIRVGELATGSFDPLTGCGHTAWNNVIWAERRRGMTIKNIAEKIRDLRDRYNLVVNPNPELAPAIIIDARGTAAGTTVKDELALPSPPVDEFGRQNLNWSSPSPIYDPTDKDYQHLRMASNTWPGLRLLWTTDQINTELVSFTKGQLEASRLYLGKFLSKVARLDPEGKLDIGYLGVKALGDQLMSIQGQPTKYAYNYYMPGSESNPNRMRKDLFSAFLYAASALRQHLTLLAKAERKIPQAIGLVVSKRHNRVSAILDTSYMRFR